MDAKNSKYMSLSEIIIDEAIYPRKNCDLETVARYREALEAGATLPPLVVMPDGRLLDGRHRYEANKLLGVVEVEVTVEEPENPDARAVELNLSHGRPLSREELREASRRWYGKVPVTEISKTLGVTRQTVQNWVSDLTEERQNEKETIREKALEMRAEGKTQEEVAGALGVTRQAVSKWESNSVKNLTLLHENIPNISYLQESGREIFVNKGLGCEYGTFWRSPTGGLHRVKSPAMPMAATREEAQKNLDEWAKKKELQAVTEAETDTGEGEPYADDRDEAGQALAEDDQKNEYPDPDAFHELELLKTIIGCQIKTHYKSGGIVTDVKGPFEDGFYTIVYNHPINGKKCWINSITVKENTILCEGVPLKITEAPGEWDKCKTCPCYLVDSCEECEHKMNPLCHDLYPDECTDEDCEEARASRREKEEGEPEQHYIEGLDVDKKVSVEKYTPQTNDDQEEKQETVLKTGRAAAEEERKKIVPYSDMVKEYFNQLKKTSELAEQLVNRREDILETIVVMEADGISFTVIANAVVQAYDIYIPRLGQAKAVLEEALKREVKGVVVKDKFMVLRGGKNNGG